MDRQTLTIFGSHNTGTFSQLIHPTDIILTATVHDRHNEKPILAGKDDGETSEQAIIFTERVEFDKAKTESFLNLADSK